MAQDWSRSAWDDLILDGTLTRWPKPGSFAVDRQTRRRPALGLPGLCLLVGVMTALLYGWPALMIANIVFGGPEATIFWAILFCVAALAGLAAWAISTHERGYWASHATNVSDWADPPTWK